LNLNANWALQINGPDTVTQRTMLDIQRDKDRERARLVNEEGLSHEAAEAVVAAMVGESEFKPAFPKNSAARPDGALVQNSSMSLFERVRAFHESDLGA
jgi:hypothetical protein